MLRSYYWCKVKDNNYQLLVRNFAPLPSGPCEFGKQTEGRRSRHLSHLSADASGSTLTPLHCHNIYIPTHNTSQGRPLWKYSKVHVQHSQARPRD